MKRGRRTKIITETKRSFSLTLRQKSARFFCPQCGTQTEMLTINEAAHLTAKNWLEIVNAVKLHEVHSSETEKGEIFICAESLKN
jgi:hypothetical protein